MTTPTDWRALCAEPVDALKKRAILSPLERHQWFAEMSFAAAEEFAKVFEHQKEN
jgi:hypothetical protein